MKDTRNTDIGSFIREREDNYNSGIGTKISKHVSFDLKSHIEKVEAYKYSKHISGTYDSLNREKPFFNIGTSASNVWYRATDLDRRNIRVKATNEKTMVQAFCATQKLHDYMRRDDFGTFLNKWGRVLADYGSAVLKFVEKEDGLHSLVIPWNRVIVDAIDFDNDAVIELLELTPDQLLQREGFDKDTVKALIDTREARETEKGEDVDDKDEFIRVYEVHGKLPKSFRTGESEDRYDYEQQMFAVSFVEGRDDGDFDDFILASGRETSNPYMITHLIEEEGRVCGIGAYEHLFEAQWMSNHTAKGIKDQLDLASKLIFQTADDTFLGQNALESIETGDILIHADNQPLTQVANNSHDITSLQAYGQQWEELGSKIVGNTGSIDGSLPPSSTAYRTVAIANRESHSLFEVMTESKGLAVERMLRKFHIPYFKKQLNDNKELSAVLDNNGIQFIDPRFIKYETNKRTKEAVKDVLLNGDISQLGEIDTASTESDIQNELAELGNQRFLKPSEIDSKTWADSLKDLEWELEVEVTNENTDKEVTMTTLTTVLQSIASNPNILQDKNASLIFNKILEETGRISPIELSTASVAPQPAPQQLPQNENMAPQEPT